MWCPYYTILMQNAQALIKILLLFRMLRTATGKNATVENEQKQKLMFSETGRQSRRPTRKTRLEKENAKFVLTNKQQHFPPPIMKRTKTTINRRSKTKILRKTTNLPSQRIPMIAAFPFSQPCLF